MTDVSQTLSQGQPPLPPGQPPAPQPQPPARKRSRRMMLIGGGVLVGLIICGALIVGLVATFGGQEKAEPWKLSAEQRRVVEEFGPPQTFSVICAADPTNDDPGEDGFRIHRIETWYYHELGARFYFRDGHAVGDKAAPVLPAGTTFAKLRPEEFYRGMSVEDVVKVVGAAPTKAADIAPGIFEGLQAYVFGNQVMAEFDQDRLVGVQTAPLIPTEDEQ